MLKIMWGKKKPTTNRRHLHFDQDDAVDIFCFIRDNCGPS